ncbi:hypothetical protein PN498_23195 [Oscillatoria sp. CS-180]|uniref:hypothetical protein n=1 Tax=Oscillatoria sp. CS-180 TaxID=3021720 RepID=UPI00232C8295|nr:hypothetical protein [Oscillatoria sp. CS-180]MDB9528918.1 hypothetical protein [Oscillatoria sp. CS-180]
MSSVYLLEERISVSDLITRETIGYRSAIALALATSLGADPVAVSLQLVDILRVTVPPILFQPADAQALTQYISINSNDQGWLTLSITDEGIAAWLRSVNTLSVKLPAIEMPQTFPPYQGRLPLCDRLKLSFPMLIQWTQTRCNYWLERSEMLISQSCKDSHQYDARSTLVSAWTHASPVACHALLHTTIRAVDTLATQKRETTAYLRQGYALCEALYQLDAAITTTMFKNQTLPIQTSLQQTIKAAQKVLALIVTTILEA